MFVAAVLPAASELTMVYGGALASGALAGHIAHFQPGFRAYLAVVVVGVSANMLGAAVGWAIGYYGGHPLLERHGTLAARDAGALARAERWFDRFGTVAVPLGFATPLVRSFVALPAGILEMAAAAALAAGRARAAPSSARWSPASAGRSGRAGSVRSHDLRYVDVRASWRESCCGGVSGRSTTPLGYD